MLFIPPLPGRRKFIREASTRKCASGVTPIVGVNTNPLPPTMPRSFITWAETMDDERKKKTSKQYRLREIIDYDIGCRSSLNFRRHSRGDRSPIHEECGSSHKIFHRRSLFWQTEPDVYPPDDSTFCLHDNLYRDHRCFS